MSVLTRARRLTLIATSVAAATVATALPASATTTYDIPTVRSTLRVVVFANGIAAPAQVSFDIGMKDAAGVMYYPCANPNEPFKPACSVGNYYHVVNVSGSADLTYGLPIYNTDAGLTHNWSQRVVQANLEITATDAAAAYGKARLTMTGFTIPFEGDPTHQMRTASTGVIPLPHTGNADAGSANGYVRNNGVLVTTPVNLNYFGHTDTGHATASGNWTAYGLGGGAVTSSSGGYYTTRPMWKGHYDVNVLANGHKWVCAANVQGAVRADYELAKSDLGQPGVCSQSY
jgi:hypothetical protein